MGFFKKSTTSYPAARRNRINNQQSHPATVNPPAPSSYGTHNNNNVVAASVVQQPQYTAAAFPSNNAPVQATVYVPGSAPQQATSQAAPVQASVYVPGNNNTQTTTTQIASPVIATAPPPSTNPMYSNQRPSFNNGNGSYKSDEGSFWECSVCTFPNLRTEANCKGCGSPIPPGMLTMSPQQQISHAAQSVPQNPMSNMNAQMNRLNMNGGATNGSSHSSGVMRVHIPNGMLPGQKIKVRSPDGKEVVKTIPPQSEWKYDGSKPFFRMKFGVDNSPPTSTVVAGHAISSSSSTSQTVPPHSTQWRHFHTNAPCRYVPPPTRLETVPASPRGAGGLPPNGRHKALIIGINYHRSRAELRGCINDAKNMQMMLQRNGYPNDGSHMLLLTDDRSRGSEYQPTGKNIMKAFAWFMKDVRKGDILFFHFSGHGGQVPDKTGHEIDGYNETIIPVDYDRQGQISDDVLWGSLVYHLPPGARITALMDMCHSGTGLDLPYDYNVNTRRWTEDINPAHSQGDVVLFSGCEDSQTSADVGGGFNKQAGGAMTQAFMKAYEQTAAMSTYHEFLHAVKHQLRKKRYSQRPQLTSSQQFDAQSRIFSVGYQTSGIPSTIEPNHNSKIGRQKRRHVRPARQGFGGGGGGGGNNMFSIFAGAAGAGKCAFVLFYL